MTQAALAAAILIASGKATSYSPGVMDRVAANRISWGEIGTLVEHRGYVALLDCDYIGSLVWLQHGARVDGPYMVADCASDHDRARLVALGFAVDLSWEVAQEWGVIRRPVAGFKVWSVDPRLPLEVRCE